MATPIETHEDARLYTLNVTNANFFLNDSAYSNVTFNIPKFIQKLDQTIATYVSIENITLPSSWYVLDETNNVLDFSIATNFGEAVFYDFTFDELGTYDAYSMVNLLNKYNTDFNITEFSWTYSIYNNRIGLIWNVVLGQQYEVVFYADNSTIKYLLGFKNDVDFLSQPETTSYLPNQVNFTGVNTYLVVCDQLPVQNWSVQLQSNVLGSIQNAAGVWGLTLWQNQSNLRYSIPLNHCVDFINIRIYSETGKLINFRDSPWDLTLKVTYVRLKSTISPEMIGWLDQQHQVNQKNSQQNQSGEQI